MYPNFGQLSDIATIKNINDTENLSDPFKDERMIDRTNFNKFITGSLAYVLNRKHRDKVDKNKVNFLLV